MANNNFIDAEGKIIKNSAMSDEHSIIKIEEKKPVLTDIGRIVVGDTNSNILQFEINRYYDGVDLLNKDIRFIVSNSQGIFTEKAVNLLYNNVKIRFSWVLSYAVTCKSGNIQVAIEFFGKEDSMNYSLKTLPFAISVENSIDAIDMTSESPENWFVDFETRLSALENGINIDDIVEEVKDNIEFETELIDWIGEYKGGVD